jgi:uncharacterized DUF497 family protein
LARLALAVNKCSRIVVVTVEVDWTHGAEHMRAEHGLTPQEADEAAADIDAVWFDPDPASKSGRSVRVIGYSRSRRAVLTVILVHRDGGGYWGANGWESNAPDRRRYEKGE